MTTTVHGLPELDTSSKMVYNPVREASAISEIASFFFDIGKLMVQSKKLYKSYLRTRNLDDLQQALHNSQKILDQIFPHVSSMPTILLIVVPQDLQHMVPIVRYALARSLLRKFQYTRQVGDITKAIEMFRGAHFHFQLVKNDDMIIIGRKCITYLGLSYLERDGNLDGFSEVNAYVRQLGESRAAFAYNLTANKSYLIRSLAEDCEMFDYFRWTLRDIESRLSLEPSLQELNFLIQLFRQALKVCPKERVFLEFILPKLGRLLLLKSGTPSNLEELNEAIECLCDGLKFMSQTSPHLGYYLILTSNACSRRYQTVRSRQDLDDAVRYARQATEVIDSQDSRFRECLENLARIATWRYQNTGDMNDLNTAIEATSRDVDIQNRDGVPSPISLQNLCALLKTRFDETRRYEDLSKAIAVVHRGMELVPPNDSTRVEFLLTLIACELAQFWHQHDANYLLLGIQHIKKACEIEETCSIQEAHSLDAHERMCRMMNCYATYSDFCAKFPDLQKELEDVDLAMTLLMERSASHDHPAALNALIRNLTMRWRRTSEIKYINEAISVARRVIKLIEGKARASPGGCLDDLVSASNVLGHLLYKRYRITGTIENREEALAFLLKAFRMVGGSHLRIEAGQLAIDILSDLADWDHACRLSREVVNLLVTVNGRSLSWQDKQHSVEMLSNRAAEYASIALEAGSDLLDVIELLETCRGSVLGHLIDNRTDLNDLMDAAPEEAERFISLLNEINTEIDPLGHTNTGVDHTARKIEAEGEIRSCLKKIRSLEGFHRFMLGLTQRELEAAAARGPIVILNISSIRSDAIIITKDVTVLLSLPELKYQKTKEYLDAELTRSSNIKETGPKNKKFRQLQEWLWNTCVKLIFEKLDNLANCPAKFHVWWIGIGIASSLPFHAAGIYTGTFSETALSRAISSYAPTVKILIHGQRKLKDHLVPDGQGLASKPNILESKPRLAIIAMPSTPGRADLEGVHQEAKIVQQISQDTYSTHVLVQPSVKDTMAKMSECEVVHFACHGESCIPNPSSSHLLLQATTVDSTIPAIEELELKDVAATDLSHGKLAFLSACSTAQDGRQGMWDEGLHLASGFQVAGYLHAIGNLWPSDDEVSVQVVEKFYRHLVAAGDLGNGENVAKALNEALLDIVDKYAKQPLCWAQFVHFGV